MKLNSYVISVPSLFHRLEKTFWKSFKCSNIVSPVLFEGIDANHSKISDWWLSKKNINTLDPNAKEPVMWALVQSYINLFDLLINKNVDEPVLILEDDSVIISPNSFDNDLTNVLTSLPEDWQVCYLSGYTLPANKLFHKNINQYVSSINCIMQTNAIIYKNSDILYILKEFILNSHKKQPIDLYFLECFRENNIKLYHSKNKLIVQENYYSSVYKTPTKPVAGNQNKWIFE